MNVSILDLLDRKGVHYKRKGDEVAIHCPNAANHQDGRDSIESFSINLEGRGAHCFACGFSLGGPALLRWLAGEDLDELTLEVMTAKTKVAQLMVDASKPLYVESLEVFFPPGSPWAEDGFRGIGLSTYRKLGAVKVSRGRYTGRIAFPVVLDGELIGVDARALEKDLQPKYLRNKNSTCKENWLYPFDVVKQMILDQKLNYVMVGEGLFHAVNAVDKNFPGLTFFGAHNFTMSKVSMLLSLGVDEVIYFPDKDVAGYEACQTICSMLESWFDVFVADTSEWPLNESATLRKGKEVYADLGDLSAESIHKSITNRTRFRRRQQS